MVWKFFFKIFFQSRVTFINNYCCRFVPDREFAGTDRSRRREGPVQFEQADEEDPFNLTEFLKTAKRGEKRAGEDSRRDYESSKSKKRRDWNLYQLTTLYIYFMSFCNKIVFYIMIVTVYSLSRPNWIIYMFMYWCFYKAKNQCGRDVLNVKCKSIC